MPASTSRHPMKDVADFPTEQSKPSFDPPPTRTQRARYKAADVLASIHRAIVPESTRHDWVAMLRHLALAACIMVTVLLIGGGVMTSLERPNELAQMQQFYTANATLHARLTPAEYDQVTDALNYDSQLNSLVNSSNKWDFKGALFFWLVVMCAIGYGPYAPFTNHGKIFTMCWGTISIVCMAYCLIVIAETTLAGLVYCYSRIYPKRSLWSLQTRLIVCAAMGVGLVFAGGGIFAGLEGYTYLDAAFLSWGTLTTLGLGGMIPKETSSRAVLGIYMVFGLGVLSTLIDYVVDNTAPSPRGLPVKADSRKLDPPPPLWLPTAKLRAHLGDRDPDQELSLIAKAAAGAGVERADLGAYQAEQAARRVRLRLDAAEAVRGTGGNVSQSQQADRTASSQQLTERCPSCNQMRPTSVG